MTAYREKELRESESRQNKVIRHGTNERGETDQEEPSSNKLCREERKKKGK